MRVGNARRALALVAAKLYPRQPQTIAAVTGTSGKTSVAAFTRQIWTALGHRAASIGTIGVVSPRGETYGSLTTPDPVALHRSLDALAGDGVTHLAIEASSHGLDQYRLDGLRIAAGGFTNITRDHLDYHPSFEAYLAAKLRLFEALLAPGGAAVIDVDHEHADAVVAAAKARGLSIISVGRAGTGIRLVDVGDRRFSQTLRLEHRGKNFQVRLPLVGEFQVENALVAAGLAIATGGDAGCGVRGARTSHRRQGPARARRRQAAARRSSSTTRTSPTRSPRRSMRCGPMRPAGSSWCSAPAATAIAASGR